MHQAILIPARKLKRIVSLVALLLCLYSLCRLLFYVGNKSLVGAMSLVDTILLFWHGLRFDIAAICMTNGLFFLLALLPVRFVNSRFYQRVLQGLFIIINGLFLLVNVIDVAYFPFVQKRMQWDALLFVNGQKGTEFYSLLPQFLKEYWYLWLVYVLLLIGLVKGYKLINSKFSRSSPGSWKVYIWNGVLFMAVAGATVIGIRGGLQMKVLDIINAAETTDAAHIPVVLNTTFSLIKTADKKAVGELRYYPDEELDECSSPIHTGVENGALKKLNVVVIIVESLSQEYMSFFGGKSRTPFLDSLFSNSLVCTNGFANAKESIQGIPAVVASIPALENDPFIFSPYSANKITSLPNLLKPYGYKSHFFHGGETGTMGFNSFCKLAGFDKYYGMEDYNNPKDFDGKWGIWDELFLQYMGRELSNSKQPFCSVVFTLNTHHPFVVPETYKEKFKQEGHPILSCVRYADFALQRFFESVKQKPWFSNTLFVITADHIGPRVADRAGGVSNYRVPIAFYLPDNSLRGVYDGVANQVDILPTVMNMLYYPQDHFSVGRSLVDTGCPRFSVAYNAGVYQYIDSVYCYQFTGEKGLGLYRWKSDSLFSKNLIGKDTGAVRICDERLKKFIQVHNGALVHNRMTAENWRKGH